MATPKVYFTKRITPAALQDVYHRLGWQPSGKVAVKLSTGEQGNENYLQPALIKDLVHEVSGTIVECNTAYAGARMKTEDHRKLAAEHGFTAIAEVDIMDADGSMELPVLPGSSVMPHDLVGAHLANYGCCLVLSHFKGHPMGGFGGALKNISIGIGSSDGKRLIHSAGRVTDGWLDDDQNGFLKSMAEAAGAVIGYFSHGERMAYVNVINKLSVDCDCCGPATPPTMADIGVAASLDPVALDQACIDLVWAAPDSKDLKERVTSRNGLLTLEHAEELGLGSRKYEMVDIA